MSIFMNSSFESGFKESRQIASNTGWADFCRWAAGLPGEYEAITSLASSGTATGSKKLETLLKAAVKATSPDKSVKEVALRLAKVLPYEGTLTISDEPEDSDEEEDE